MQKSSSLDSASVVWRDDTPVSTAFDDMYFNVNEGLAESEHVFLKGNDLNNRFASLTAPHFTIAETGFGTGLNFLAARRLWLQQAPEEARLHFISVEKFPLQKADLQKALASWPELDDGAVQLTESYPSLTPGFHRLSFDGGRVQLTLMLMDAIEAYQQLSAQVDAWFLDGFAPSKNPDMWNDKLFQQMARLSYTGTTLSTFTAAGFVRRGLQQAGFSISKVPGFGRKREMVTAHFAENSASTPNPAPWFAHARPQHTPAEVVIIGAGLAGCSTAYALAQKGIKVHIVEQHAEIALEGSGNRQGALYAKLPVSHNAQGQLHLSGLHYSNRMLNSLDPQRTLWSDCGLLQLATNEKEANRQQRMLDKTIFGTDILHSVDAQQASDLIGSPTPYSGVFMPDGGWVDPRALCRRFISHPLIRVSTNTRITALKQLDNVWHLHTRDGQVITTRYVVVCNAAQAKQISQCSHLPVKPIRGQTSVTQNAVKAPAINTVVCGDGYISPPLDEQYCFGATFDLHNLNLDVRQVDHHDNLSKLSAVLPALAKTIADTPLEGRAAYRCSTGDYLPIVGPAPDYDAFVSDYAKLRVDRKWNFSDTPARMHSGLYLNIGHGSKGLITGPICGEVIAASILGEPFPLEKSVLDAINPARFIIKQLIRKAI